GVGGEVRGRPGRPVDARRRPRRGAGHDRGRLRAVPAAARLHPADATRPDRDEARARARGRSGRSGQRPALLARAPARLDRPDRTPGPGTSRRAASTLAGVSELWLPGGASADELVARVQQQVARFAETHGLSQALVEVELRDGARYLLDTISSEPGYGFITLRPHPKDEGE